LDEGSKYGIDARLIAAAMRLEPIEHVRIETEINTAPRPGNPQHDRILPTARQRTIIGFGVPLDMLKTNQTGPTCFKNSAVNTRTS
jgi:hypothetical protein